MSLSKDTFEKAKRRANERLSGWITDARKENDFGIQKLHREFRHAFKKIEYIPKEILKIDEAGKERILQRQRELGDKNQGDEKGDISRAQVSTAALEDLQDSNSSNLSSRLGNAGDDIRITESRTPYDKTPLLLLENADSKDSEQQKISLLSVQHCSYNNKHVSDLSKASNSVFGELQQRGSSRRRSAMLPLPSVSPAFMSFQKRRRSSFAKRTLDRKTMEKPKIEKVSESDEGGEDELKEQLEVMAVPSIVKKSSSVMSSSGQSQRSTVKSFKLTKGPIDLYLRRANRQYRKHLQSKHELATVKAELTSEERRQELLNRFRRCVRLLIHVRVLLNVSRLRIEEEEKSKGFKRFDGGLELSFDAAMFKCAISYSGLTSRARQALKKNPKDRTEEDAKILMGSERGKDIFICLFFSSISQFMGAILPVQEVLLRLPMFMKYPKTVKQALAHMMWYDLFQDGRVIVKQCDPGTRMYFVISGEVDLKRTDTLDTGEEICYHMRTVHAGATFGELALIRNMRREFTAVCKGTSEFLSLSKDEFNHALRSRWERDCNKRFNFLRNCEHFTAWTDKQLQMCADSSELKEYKDNTVIIGDMDSATENVYFIRNGRCEVVRRILVVRHQSPYQRPNILLPHMARRRSEFLNKPYCRDRRINRDEIRFLTVTSLHPGNYFGVGENMRDTFILSRGKTELLIINSAQFSIQGKSEQLRRLKRERENSIPSNKALYQKFQENRKWFEYRNKLLKDILLKKSTTSAGSWNDVPKSILNEPTIPKDLVFYNSKYC